MTHSRFAKVQLASLPTPLQEMPRLSHALNGPRILAKRDDLTGLALGGNKARKLEYLVAEALSEGADCIVTTGGAQSNWCTQVVAAANRYGLGSILVKTRHGQPAESLEWDGNHLLQHLMGAHIRTVPPEALAEEIESTVDDLRRKGHHPYVVCLGGSTAVGALGYVDCMSELASQCEILGIRVDYVVHPTGSGGTQAGLIVGARMMHPKPVVIGVSVGLHAKREQEDVIRRVATGTAELLEIEGEVPPDDIVVEDSYFGTGYGHMSSAKAEAIRLAAETEGLLLDPVYTGTAMSCLIDLCRSGTLPRDCTVVFLHTGGQAALFPYRHPLQAHVCGNALPWTTPAWA